MSDFVLNENRDLVKGKCRVRAAAHWQRVLKIREIPILT